ncbi:putative serine/threonine protein kinase [Blattamonas nauphoetae]|uniref:Serine/threonine protein kinase n=1 Tax=Blattamonas nauphoetae TaxID=2049346 RepID=A0ABQ9WTH2_9EUKA|nr:putative serine/threonine protein kinase [Blattamonas nauphoetae]
MPNKDSPLFKLTLDLTNLYRSCDQEYPFTPINPNLGKILTKLSTGVSNNGRDNENGDFIFRVGDIIAATDSMGNLRGRKYEVETLLGAGSFGQVLRCVQRDTYQVFAVKVIKNLPAYTKQAAVENRVLSDLLVADPNDESHMLRLIEQFTFHNHFCFVNELLGLDLYAVLKQHKFKGFSLSLISKIVKQILRALCVCKDIGLIHSDLKPENILLDHCLPHIKVIDFGSAAYEGHTVFTYVQSRYYRSPEVLLQIPYNSCIDMWSVGCITAELFIGHPLFPGCTEHDQIDRITSMLGALPHEMIKIGKKSTRFYVNDSTKPHGYRLSTTEEYQARTQDKRQPRKYGYIQPTLEQTIEAHQIKHSRDGTSLLDRPEFQIFLHFIKSCLQPFPDKRLVPHQALLHPFITGGKDMKELKEWKPPLYVPHPPYTPHPNGRQRDPNLSSMHSSTLTQTFQGSERRGLFAGALAQTQQSHSELPPLSLQPPTGFSSVSKRPQTHQATEREEKKRNDERREEEQKVEEEPTGKRRSSFKDFFRRKN